MSNYGQDTLSRKTKICYGLGEIGRGFSINLQSTFLIFYLVNYVGLAAGMVGTMVLVARIWDAVNDPMMGYLVDNTNTKYGKARPYFLFCSIPAALFLFAVFAIPANISSTAKIVWVYIAYFGVGMSFTMLDVPYNTLMVTLTNNPRERISLSMSKYLWSIIGTLLPAGLIPILAAASRNPRSVYTACAGAFAALGACCYLAVFFTTREIAVTKKQKLNFKEGFSILLKNRPWKQTSIIYFLYATVYSIVTGSILFYATCYFKKPKIVTPLLLCIMAMLAIGSALANRIVARIGKRKTILFGLLLAILCFCVRLFTADANVPLFFVCSGLQFFGMGYCAILGNPLVSDTVSYGEWKFGLRVESLSFASVTFGSKLGLGIGASIVSFILAKAKYVANSVEQSKQVLDALFAVSIVVPLVLAVIMFFVFLPYKLDSQLPEMHAALSEKASS